MTKNVFITSVLTILLGMYSAFAQGVLRGSIVDATSNEILIGANVMVTGTSNGVTTDFTGSFSINVASSEGSIDISYVGYTTKTISYTLDNGKANLGLIPLDINSAMLGELELVGTNDIAKDRETPIAVSTIPVKEITEKLGSQEFPELLRSTPSVYVTKQGGGFGDARINIRGFDQSNSAVMINGMPVNDMENGWVYWSNWAGLSDVTSAMQIQRGLGASKLAISSVGGTINVVTKTSDQKEGGQVLAGVGNDGYHKVSAAYNTGMQENGWSASVLLARTAGDGYVDGTKFEGYSYFFGLGKKINDKHNLQFNYFGAKQYHHQRSYAPRLSDYIKYSDEDGGPDIRYNSDWGKLDGEEFSWRRNFYNKPLAQITYDWKINSKSNISAVAYASWGRGGGTGPIGEINGAKEYYGQFRGEDGLVRFDDIVAWNSGSTVDDFKDNDGNGATRTPNSDGKYINDRKNGFTRRASMNSHDWYGMISTYANKLNDDLTLDVGIDLRTYTGYHYRVVNDYLGADGYLDDRDINNPDRYITELIDAESSFNPFINIKDQQKIEYYNLGKVGWLGAFTQLEYQAGNVSAFVQGSLSQQSFQRIEKFKETPATEKTDWERILGGNVKAGLNYNIDSKHNVFANAGFYSRQPNFDAVFINYGNNLNPDLQNEKVMGLELGYGFRSSKFSANVNVYHTTWKDRYYNESNDLDVNNTPDNPDDDIRGSVNLYGVEQIHSGLELDGLYRVTDNLKLRGMLSVGNWVYGDNVSATYLDNDNDVIMSGGQPVEETLYLKDVKVGDAAQFTMNFGAEYQLLNNLKVDAGIYHAGMLYAKASPTDFNRDGHEGALELPSYELIDAGISYDFVFKDSRKLNLRLNVNNLLDKVYISEATTNRHAGADDETWEGVNTSNNVFFGLGRTWNLTARFSF